MNLRKAALAAPLVFLASCSSVKDELYEPDGFVAPHFNKRLTAVTQEQRADRYLIAFAIVAPLALETSDDGQDKTNIISRINFTQKALADLYTAAGKNPTALSDPAPTQYAFETLGYDVQKQLYRLSKELIIQLNLDETAEDIVDLDIPAMTRLYDRMKELFPVVRRGAATYRDAIYAYGSAVSESCEGPDCTKLVQLLNAQYAYGEPTSRDAMDRRYFEQVLDAAKKASATRKDTASWSLGQQRRLALLFHIQKACDAAFKTQDGGENPAAEPLNCGSPQKLNNENYVSQQRQELIEAIK